MTAGLPGVGIGGIFYLASALLMPVRSLFATLHGRGHEARWGLALRQASLAISILGAVWLTGLGLGWLINALLPPASAATAVGASTPSAVHNVVKTTALLLSFGTLGVVLLGVQVLRFALPVKTTELNSAGERRKSARTAA